MIAGLIRRRKINPPMAAGAALGKRAVMVSRTWCMMCFRRIGKYASDWRMHWVRRWHASSRASRLTMASSSFSRRDGSSSNDDWNSWLREVLVWMTTLALVLPCNLVFFSSSMRFFS